MATVLQAAVRSTTRVIHPGVARVGVEPTESPGLSRAALPVCVPCRLLERSTERDHGESNPERRMDSATCCRYTMAPFSPELAQEGFEPSASLVLSESGLPIAYRAAYTCTHDPVPGVGVEPTGTRV